VRASVHRDEFAIVTTMTNRIWFVIYSFSKKLSDIVCFRTVEDETGLTGAKSRESGDELHDRGLIRRPHNENWSGLTDFPRTHLSVAFEIRRGVAAAASTFLKTLRPVPDLID
jgi:hypothetical protein